MGRFLLVPMALMAAGLLQSCGQKGPLYLPTSAEPQESTLARSSQPTREQNLTKAWTDSQR
jgi:predicted small lipoprotein YifL